MQHTPVPTAYRICTTASFSGRRIDDGGCKWATQRARCDVVDPQILCCRRLVKMEMQAYAAEMQGRDKLLCISHPQSRRRTPWPPASSRSAPAGSGSGGSRAATAAAHRGRAVLREQSTSHSGYSIAMHTLQSLAANGHTSLLTLMDRSFCESVTRTLTMGCVKAFALYHSQRCIAYGQHTGRIVIACLMLKRP
jgi:hypothetical protein